MPRNGNLAYGFPAKNSQIVWRYFLDPEIVLYPALKIVLNKENNSIFRAVLTQGTGCIVAIRADYFSKEKSYLKTT